MQFLYMANKIQLPKPFISMRLKTEIYNAARMAFFVYHTIMAF